MNFIKKSENLRNYLLTNDFKTVIIVTNQKMKGKQICHVCVENKQLLVHISTAILDSVCRHGSMDTDTCNVKFVSMWLWLLNVCRHR